MTKEKSVFIKNIYYMLTYAYQILRHQNYANIETESFENVQDMFASILAHGITNQLKRGICREYIEKNDVLTTLRGKIDVRGSISQKIRRNRRLACLYDELSENCYMNQILKTTALRLIGLPDSVVKRQNKDALKRAILFFSNVDIIEPISIKWNALQYSKNNATYQMLMNICYLSLSMQLQTTESGSHKLANFLDEQKISKLYEKFILEYYKKEFPDFTPEPKQICWNVGGQIKFPSALPKMQSDVILSKGKNRLIIDAKFYSKAMQIQYDKRTFHSHHLYQIFTYVKNEDKENSGNVSGILLYAKTDEDIVPDGDYLMSKNRISVKTLNLNTDFITIKEQLNALVEIWLGNCLLMG